MPQKTIFAIINPVTFQKVSQQIRYEWWNRGSRNEKLIAVAIQTPAWTAKSLRLPVQRPKGLWGKGGVQFYIAQPGDQELWDELHQQGKVVFELQNTGDLG